LKLARFILEELIDDCTFAWAGCLEEGDLASRLQGDDLAQIDAADRGFPDKVRCAFLGDIATRAEATRKKKGERPEP